MANFWKQVKGWFKDADESSPTKPFIEEQLERTEAEKEDLKRWKLSDACMDFCSLVYDSFLENKRHSSLTFLKFRSSSGFIINLEKEKAKLRDAQRFMDFLQEKVLSFNYKRQNSNYRLYTKNNKTEKIERFYMKPRLNVLEDRKVDQLYGNVMIELTIREEKPLKLKFQVNRYSDRNYSDGRTFEQLMEELFS